MEDYDYDMKLEEAFAKRRTYDRPKEIRVGSLERALDKYDQIVGFPHFHTSDLWKEVQESLRQHLEDYPDDDPVYWTFNATMSFIRAELKTAFEKM